MINKKLIFFIAATLLFSLLFFYKEISEKVKHSKLVAKPYEKIVKFANYRDIELEKLERLDFINSETLAAGKAEMQKHKVIFTGISRDNAAELPGVIRHIEHLAEHFADYRVIIFENDSLDPTKVILQLWAMINPKIKVIFKDFKNKKRPSIKFLADARNYYVQELMKKEYDDFDLVIALDMDMSYGFDPRGIADSFSKINRWDAVCSNGIFDEAGTMYDAFAFRNEEFPYGPAEYKIKTGKEYWSSDNISSMQRIYDPQLDLIPVNSCFNGLAIYKKGLFDNCIYDSIDEDCEHVYLHQCMKAKHKARIFLNPAQVIRYSHYYD